jgi:hypothetical protein
MPRVLTAEWTEATGSQRETFLARARNRRDVLRAAGCNYWVFENGAAPGSFLEFLESSSADVLRAARSSAGATSDAPILTEVELD